MSRADVTRDIIEFVTDELLGNRRDLTLAPGDDLLASGLIDSLGVTRLIRFLERRFDISVPPADVTIENFMTVDTIATYLDTRGIANGTPSAD